MVKSISSLIDSKVPGSGNEESEILTRSKLEESKANELLKASQEQQSIEILEMAPIQEIADKIQNKKLLTKEELNAISLCLTNKFSDMKDFFGAEAIKVREILLIGYYAIINTHSFNLGPNYLEHSALLKLCKESLSTVKKLVDLLSKKDCDIKLYNETLPVILKFMSLFQAKANYGEAYYRYLRSSSFDLHFDTIALSYLNPYLVEIAPQVYQSKRSQIPGIKQEQDIISLSQSANFSEDDSLEKVLDFVPQDYSALNSLLQQHLQSKLQLSPRKDDDFAMNQQEEEKGEPEGDIGRDVYEACKEHITKLKLIDLTLKSIDKLASIAESGAHLLQYLNSDLFPKVLNFVDTYPQAQAKLKKLPQFVGKGLLDSTLAIQSSLASHIEEKLASHMEVEGTVNTQTQSALEITYVEEALFSIAKQMEIMFKISQQCKDQETKIHDCLNQIIEQSDSFSYLSKIVKQDRALVMELEVYILSITKTVVQHLATVYKNRPIPQVKLVYIMTTVTSLIKVNRSLTSVTDQKDRQSQSIELSKVKSVPVTSTDKQKHSDTIIKTRSQIKKELGGVINTPPKETTSAKKRKQESKEEKTRLSHDLFIRLEPEELLKHSLSFLVLILPQYTKLENPDSRISLSKRLLSNFFSLASAPSSLIHHLVYGIISELTRPKMLYSDDSLHTIQEYLLNKLHQIQESHTQTTFTLRLMMLFKNQAKEGDLPLRITENLILNSQWMNKKGTLPQNLSEIYDFQNLKRYLIFNLAVILMNKEMKKKAIETALKNLNKEGSYLLNLHLIQTMLLSPKSISKLKPLIYQYLTKLYLDDEQESKISLFITDLENSVQGIFNQQNGIYDIQTLSLFESNLQLDQLLKDVRTLYLPHIKVDDKKQFILPLLTQILKLTSELQNLGDNSQKGSLLHQYQELYQTLANEEATNNLERQIKHAKFERVSAQLNQQIVQKLSQNGSTAELSAEELKYIETQAFMLKQLSKQSQQQQIQILSKQIEGNSVEYATVLLEFAKLTMPNVRYKIQSIIIFTTNEEKNQVEMIINSQLMVKIIAQLQSQKDEENIYAHTLSTSNNNDEMQNVISNCLLLKQVYTNLFAILNAANMNKFKDMIQELGVTLLQIKSDNPFLEFNEASSSYDHDMNDKILQRSGAVNLANKDFLRIRTLDSSLNCLFLAQNYIQTLMNSETTETEEQRKFLMKLVDDISQNIGASSFKSTEDINVLSSYLQASSENSNNSFFKNTMKGLRAKDDLCTSIWDYTLKYLNQSLLFNDENVDKNQRKGGVQVMITFQEKKPGSRKVGQKRSAQKTDQQQSQSQISQESVASPIKKSPQINNISSKLFNFICDLMTDKADHDENKKCIANKIRQGYLFLQFTQENLMAILSHLNQLPFCKKIIGLLLSTQDKPLRTQLQEKLYSQLLEDLNQSQLSNDESLLSIVELAQMIIDSNQQYLSFLADHILPRCLTISTTKLQLLDLMCQLGQSKFSKIKKDQIKYSIRQIQERRKKIQEDKVNENKRKQQLNKQLIDDQEDRGLSQMDKSSEQAAIEGYKQDKLIRESDYQRFMEKPEEFCTFTVTKKDFRQQHWYFCYSCGLTGSNGCCAVCARKCHKGHHVVYSRKSNFFCDCGDSGKCQSLSSGNNAPNDDQIHRPSTSKRARKEDHHHAPPEFRQQNQPLFSHPGGQAMPSIFGIPPPSSRLFGAPPQSFEMMDDVEDDAAIIFRHLGGYIDNPPAFLKYSNRLGGPAGAFQFLSESSEDDIMRDENEEIDDMGGHIGLNEDQPLHQLKTVRNFMQMIKKSPNRIAEQLLQSNDKQPFQYNLKKEPDLSSSNISVINPMDDPLSEVASTPVYRQNFLNDRKDSFANFSQTQMQSEYDIPSIDEIEKFGEAIEQIKKQQNHFDSLYEYLLSLIEKQLANSQQEPDEEMSIFASPRKANSTKQQSLLQFKDNVKLVSDLTHQKKQIKEATFNFKQTGEITKQAISQNLNLLNIVDSNRDGLVAVCEDQEISIYAGSQFFEDQSNSTNQASIEQFTYQVKEGCVMNKVDTQKFTFQPLQVKFNPQQPYYLCVVGAQNVEVLSLTQQGKVSQRVNLDLLLDMISQDLTIVNVSWVPGTQSMIAVGTKEFVKIYDLSEDTISPTHNILIFQGHITDFTFSKHRVDQDNQKRAKATIYIGSKSGSIFLQEISFKVSFGREKGQDMSMDYEDNSQLMLTRTVQFDAFIQPNPNQQVLSLFYSHQTDCILLSYAGGTMLMGKIDNQDKLTGFRFNVSEDPSFQNSTLKALWQKYGENLVCFKDLGQGVNKKGANDQTFYFQAISRRQGNNQSGIPAIIEISSSNASINLIKTSSSSTTITPCIGLISTKNSKRQQNIRRLIAFNNDGSAQCLSCNSLPGFQESGSNENTIKPFNAEKLIQKADLPKEVKLSINFFEKMKNIYNDPILKPRFSISGDIINYFKDKKHAFDNLSKITAGQPVLIEQAKKSIKFIIKLDSASDHLLTGFRIKIEHNKSSHSVQLKLFNRVVKLKTQSAIWFDIPFCDAEIIFGSQNGHIELELITDDVKTCPIKIYAIEVFAQGRKEFGYREKLRRLEKLSEKASSKESAQEVGINNEESIQNELLKSKGVPLVSWKEKNSFLRKLLDEREVIMIQALDVISQFIGLNQAINIQSFSGLVDKLKVMLRQSLLDQSDKKLFIAASVKRCLRQTLSVINPQAVLGEPMNFQTIKDQILVQVINQRLDASDLSLSELRLFIHNLQQIYLKRHYQLFKIIESNENMISQIANNYLRLLVQGDSKTSQDIMDLLSLILANYHQIINRQIQIDPTQKIGVLIDRIYQNDEHTGFFKVLKQFILHNDEQIQKIVISTIVKLINQYSATMTKILKHNQCPSVLYFEGDQQSKVNILIIDFSPHLLKYLLSNIDHYRQQGDLLYSASYKIIKTFEQNCLTLYSQHHNFLEHLINHIASFISSTMVSIRGDTIKLYEQTESHNAQYLYVNLLLCNLLMQESNVDNQTLKIKGSNLGLNKEVKDLIIKRLASNPNTILQYIEWATSILQSYEQGYREGKGSYKTQVEDGIPGKVKENFNGANQQGSQLLRPIIAISTWKWHPFFMKSDGVFDLLDRKIPAQILLNIQFVGSQFDISEQNQSKMIEAIRNVSFKKPTKVFLKELGEQSLRKLLSKNLSQKEDVEKQINISLKGSVAFQEFFQVFEPIYYKYIKKNIQMAYNMQFQTLSLLQKVWKKASAAKENWITFIQKAQENYLAMLFEASFNLNDDSALLSLGLCALGLESPESGVSVKNAIAQPSQHDLFKSFNQQNTQSIQTRASQETVNTDQLDIQRLIDVMLLGRNKKELRVAAGYLLKGIYENTLSQTKQGSLVEQVLNKLKTLKTEGVNSLEFIAVASYIVNSEMNNKTIDHSHVENLANILYQEILDSNQQLTAHPNLEIYSTLQKITQAFSQNPLEEDSDKKFEMLKDNLLVVNKSPFGDQINISSILNKNKKITNPYLLESEVCSKCYEQKSLPFQIQRLNDIKVEAKFTDSTQIYKLSSTYMIKQITFNFDNQRGLKVIKTINVYVNNKQGVDLADMKNNWNYWKRVKTVEVDIGSRNLVIDFTLPVNASNMLLEYQTVNLTKPINGKDRAPLPPQIKGDDKVQSIHHISGLDSVLMTLPRNVAAKFGKNLVSKQGEAVEINQSSAFEKEQMSCPRCGKAVQGKHGICNSCGENALQCTFCRNINYEKPDGFLCNECGFSRFVKIDVNFSVKQGFATEKIENEDNKNQALQQIEQHLEQAQNSFSQLMKRRLVIQQLVKKLNEGSNGASSKLVQEIYGDECADLYQKMMRSLQTIKVLKIELNQFTQGNIPQQEEQDSLSQFKQSDESSGKSQKLFCFSCIQEYLRGLLNFVDQTSNALSKEYHKGGFVDLLYSKTLKMYSSILQEPARKAICSILIQDEAQSTAILQRIETDLFGKEKIIPAHLLSQNICQESQLVIELLEDQLKLQQSNQNNISKQIFNFFWSILFRSLKEGQQNAAIADQVSGSFLKYLKDLVTNKKSNQENQEDQVSQELIEKLYAIFQPQLDLSLIQEFFTHKYQEYLNNQNFLTQGLILEPSHKVREQSMEIIQFLANKKKEQQTNIISSMIQILDQVLVLDASSAESYFDLLTQLLSPAIIKEKLKDQSSLSRASENYIYVETFERLFKQIDTELDKLMIQEKQKTTLGNDGFMPQISTGQILSRLVTLIQSMIKESDQLKSFIQSNVNLVIKSFLKIRKLNLTKNKLVQNSESAIEEMFKKLHSEKEEDKKGFILECFKIIESGQCDSQEMRFLFEEICKVIDPVKPEPEYLLNLVKAPSQEFYFRGKMSKNPYPSKQLGKTMADVRTKICKEMEVHEPELLELLVSGKIVSTDLTIVQVYEQVFWPALCRQRNPDLYDIPSIEEAATKQALPAMNVTFRLMGIDGEATEDRVETLQDSNEADSNPSNIEKKYGITSVLCEDFESKQAPGSFTNGIKVLIKVLESFGSLHRQRYLAEWLFKLIGFVLKIKSNRIHMIRNKQTLNLLAKRLFESVGIQSQIEGQKGQSLFDVILGILEQIVVEVNLAQDQESNSEDRMEIDQLPESIEAATHVEIFISIMGDSCNDMISNHQQLDKTSKKIRAVSKILPFLINKEDNSAIQIIVEFIIEALSKITQLDKQTNSNDWTNKDKFTAQFNLERVNEILESTPQQKSFLKDRIFKHESGNQILSLYQFLSETSLKDPNSEALVYQYKSGNQYLLKFLSGLLKNHPGSQKALQNYQLLDKLYALYQAKFKDKLMTVLAQDIIESLTNKNHNNDPQVKEYLQKIIDQQNDEKKKLAQKKKEEIMRQMQMKKTQNKFLKQIESVTMVEEEGPKCIVCQEGYTKKTTDVLGMYVFSKRLKINEMSSGGFGFITTHGYTTVTHSNFIHFLCHQNAYKADSSLRQPKKEWEGAAIRNDHTKCNNLFPIRGGNLPGDSYGSMVDKYFQIQVKTIGQCDSDRVKVVLHDLKMVLKRLAYEDSFSRDTHGGGPEHNMHNLPFMIQMIQYLLNANSSIYLISHTDGSQDKNFTFIQQRRLFEFLEQGLKLKKDFMQKLEEEKKAEEIEEEEKFSEDMSESVQEEDDEEASQMSDLSLDQIFFNLTKALIFCQMPKWEQYKSKFLSIILCTVASMREEKDAQQPKPTGQQSDFATGKKVITISRIDDVQMSEQIDFSTVKRRRLSSDNKIELIQKALIRLRPLLLTMRLVDSVKQRWDGKRFGILGPNEELSQEAYLQKLIQDFLAKGNLAEVIRDSDDMFKEYKDRMLKIASVEEFLQELGMLDKIIQEHGTVEQYVLSHF